jgi:hypothetical protein
MGSSTDLVVAGHARNPLEAEMIRGLLESSGIPSIVQAEGITGKSMEVGLLNMVGGGSQQILVHADRLDEARALLAAAVSEEEDEDETGSSE